MKFIFSMQGGGRRQGYWVMHKVGAYDLLLSYYYTDEKRLKAAHAPPRDLENRPRLASLQSK